jgi:hypothetical protein
MRIVLILVALGLLGLGFAFGALNPARVVIDLFGLELSLRLGLALLLAALCGALTAGLLLWLTVVLPQLRRLRGLALELKTAESAQRMRAP